MDWFTKKNKSVEPVSTWQSIFQMTRLGSETTIIRLHAFIFFVNQSMGEVPTEFNFFLILKEFYTDMK